MVPVDGTVAVGVGVLDQSALTGEAMPVQPAAGEAVMSGSTNAGEAFDLRRDAARRREHLCRHRPAGRGGAALAGRRWRGWPTASRCWFLAVTVAIAGGRLVV